MQLNDVESDYTTSIIRKIDVEKNTFSIDFRKNQYHIGTFYIG